MSGDPDQTKNEQRVFDLAIIGGGVNGTGIARDAALRGLKVILMEQGDIGGATSSNSTKLIHGGLRYLEYYDFAMVRHALKERALLLDMMPRFVRPQHFILPLTENSRPAWLIRLGLFIYDHLGPRGGLPKARRLSFANTAFAAPLKRRIVEGFRYCDCWVDDARLSIFNALEAASAGAEILSRTKVLKAREVEGEWHLGLEGGRAVKARALVNATGPFVNKVEENVLGTSIAEPIRLVKGSHIVTKKLYDHKAAYMLQQTDGRIIFVLPFEDDFTLIGTTEEEFEGDPLSAEISRAEQDYLIRAVNQSFKAEISASDICWTFSGVRPLFDDGAKSAKAASRDFKLVLERGRGGEEMRAPLISVYGGKLTTFRALAAEAVDMLRGLFPSLPATSTDRLAYAAFDEKGYEEWHGDLLKRLDFLPDELIQRWVQLYGRRVDWFTQHIESAEQAGLDFGGGLRECEVRYLIDHEWAFSADDVLWRGTKCGLHMSEAEKQQFQIWMDGL